ncbi:methyltransferase type 11 [Bisporella sp. PMI_857]|nr:methyltransferase type 11 [Bisporella sp. PMI_857]
MAQNIYDDETFFQGYSQLQRQIHGLEAAPEWDFFQSLIPEVRGRSVLDLGCGYGWLCRWARENGAERVQGVDVSENMLSKARDFPQDSGITYIQADLETLELPLNAFQVVYSSLTLHYLKKLSDLIVRVYGALNPGGCFIFSVEHPIYTSPRDPKFIETAEGKQVWLLDNYLNEGDRITNWFAEGVVKQHRTIGTYIRFLLEAGFAISAVEEWGPSDEQIKTKPSWAEHRERPMFLIIKATKSDDTLNGHN